MDPASPWYNRLVRPVADAALVNRAPLDLPALPGAMATLVPPGRMVAMVNLAAMALLCHQPP
jgi:hypothetical protein